MAVESLGATTQGATANVVARYFDRAIEALAAILLVAEIIILSAGVTARYVFHSPLVWADELASILFVWLTVLGAIAALRRGGHLRLTAFVNRAQGRRREYFDVTAALVSALFFLMLILPAHEHYEDGWYVITPALSMPGAWRSGAIFFGAIAMVAISALQVVERIRSPAGFIFPLLAIAALALALWLARPLLMSMGNYNLIVFFAGIVAICLVIGVPIAFAFGLATFAYLGLMTPRPLSVVVSRMDEGMGHMILLSIPLFILLGVLVEMVGMARALVNFLASLLGHVRAGLSYVLIGAMYLISGISGAKAADMAAVAPVLFPEMQRRGEKPGELVSLIAASAVMAETIPPSLVLITWGSVTGVSIAALFIGGLMPAAVLALILAVVAYFRSQRDETRPPRATMAIVGRTLLLSIPALALLLIIRAAVLEGVATATEVSTIGIVYSLLIGGLFYRELDWRRLYPMLVDTAVMSGAIMLIIGAATAMAWALTQSGFSRDLVTVMTHLPGGAPTFMIISILVFIIFGSVLEGIPAIVLFGPLLYPIAHSLGINDVHYAMVAILAMGLGLYMPPFGLGYYTACAIGKIDPDEAMARIWPYLGALFIGILIVAAVPWISTGFLPK